MATIQHNSLVGSEVHEPKGINTATAGQVYVADGKGSGVWTNLSLGDLSGLDGRGSGHLVLKDGMISAAPYGIFASAYSDKVVEVTPEEPVILDLHDQEVDFAKGIVLSNNKLTIETIGVYRATYTISFKGKKEPELLETVIPGYDTETVGWTGATVQSHIPGFTMVRGGLRSNIIEVEGEDAFSTITNDGYITLYGEKIVPAQNGSMYWLEVSSDAPVDIIGFSIVLEYMGEV